jgi:hypothetical protein
LVLAKTLEKQHYRMPSLGGALAALAAPMNSTDAAPLAERLAKVLGNPHEDDYDRLWTLGEALAALAARMNPNDAVPVSERLVKALGNPEEKNTLRLWALGEALANVAAQIQRAKQTQLAALSFLLLRPVSSSPLHGEPEAHDRITVAKVCSLLATNVLATTDLVEVLKWPFCVGEAQKLVLVELGKRTQRDFGGDVWKFVEQVDSLGIPGVNSRSLELPPKRPQITNAIAELQLLTQAVPKKL